MVPDGAVRNPGKAAAIHLGVRRRRERKAEREPRQPDRKPVRTAGPITCVLTAPLAAKPPYRRRVMPGHDQEPKQGHEEQIPVVHSSPKEQDHRVHQQHRDERGIGRTCEQAERKEQRARASDDLEGDGGRPACSKTTHPFGVDQWAVRTLDFWRNGAHRIVEQDQQERYS